VPKTLASEVGVGKGLAPEGVGDAVRAPLAAPMLVRPRCRDATRTPTDVIDRTTAVANAMAGIRFLAAGRTASDWLNRARNSGDGTPLRAWSARRRSLSSGVID
jgi:hypothetical protein